MISISILYFPLGENESDYVYHGGTEFFGLNDNSLLEFKNHPPKIFDWRTAGSPKKRQ